MEINIYLLQPRPPSPPLPALVRRRKAEHVHDKFWSGAANNLVIFSFPR